MAVYRVRLRLNGPLATPLHSGALFGHLCWAMHYLDGAAKLERWLERLPEQPLLLSDAFPAGCLPRPLLAPGARPEPRPGESSRDFTQRAQRLKDARKTPWLRVEDFLSLRAQLSESRLLARLPRQGRPDAGKTERIHKAHNTIDRLTGTTPAAGGLYFMDETWHDDKARDWDVYARTKLGSAELERLFAHVGEFGFGRDGNLGRGRFSVQVSAAEPALFEYHGDRLLSLSHGALSPNMEDARYKLHTHYGKLGGLYAGGPQPFKHPLLLLRPGATFSPGNAGPFGALLRHVHPHHPEVVHNAWHLCLPYTETVA